MTLDPEDSLLLRNSTDVILQAAVRDVVKDKLDLKVLKASESLRLIGYLYEDEAQFEEIAEGLRNHPGIRRATENFEKLTVLAPRSTHGWTQLQSIYGYLDDDERLKKMAKRLEDADLDQTDSDRNYQVLKNGEMDDVYRSHSNTSAEFNRQVVANRRANPDATFAVAVGEQIDAHTMLTLLGDTVDLDADATLAVSAHEAIPCSGLNQKITATHFAVVLHSTKTQSTECSQLCEQYGRVLSTEVLLLLSLQKDKSLVEKVRQHPRYSALIQSIQLRMQHFPENASATRYLLMQMLSENSIAAECRKRLLDDDMVSVKRRLVTILTPMARSPLMDNFWFYTLARKPDLAAETLELLRAVEPDVAQMISNQ